MFYLDVVGQEFTQFGNNLDKPHLEDYYPGFKNDVRLKYVEL